MPLVTKRFRLNDPTEMKHAARLLGYRLAFAGEPEFPTETANVHIPVPYPLTEDESTLLSLILNRVYKAIDMAAWMRAENELHRFIEGLNESANIRPANPESLIEMECEPFDEMTGPMETSR